MDLDALLDRHLGPAPVIAAAVAAAPTTAHATPAPSAAPPAPTAHPDLGLRGYQSCQGTDGIAYSARLTLDGRMIGEVADGGHGGGADVRWTRGSEATQTLIMDWIASLPPEETEWGSLTWSLDMVMGSLVEVLTNRKRFRRALSRSILFQLPGDDSDSWRTIKGKWNEIPFSKWLATNYPDTPRSSVVVGNDIGVEQMVRPSWEITRA